MKSFLTPLRFAIITVSLLGLVPLAAATENDRLTREERERVGHVYAQVIRDQDVQQARQAHEEATKHYHHILRQEMIQYDPKIQTALEKIQMNPTLLAEAIWEKRNKEVLHNLHLPVGRLDADERKRWDHAMDKLRETEMTKAFAKRLEKNYQQQANLRKQQNHLLDSFKSEARRKMLTLDHGLKTIFEKLDASEVKETPTTDPSQPTVIEEEMELVPAMPMPMPPPSEEY